MRAVLCYEVYDETWQAFDMGISVGGMSDDGVFGGMLLPATDGGRSAGTDCADRQRDHGPN